MRLAVCVLDVGGVGQHRLRCFKVDPLHGFAEQSAVFGHVDGFWLCADHLDIVAVEHAHALQGKGCVQRRLAAHCRQQRVRALLRDDLGHHFRRNRLDVSRVRQIGVGHDGCGIGVDEDDAVAFLFQRFTGLCAGIIELACLTDDNRTSADDKDGFDILALRHGSRSAFRVAQKTAKVKLTGRGRNSNLFRLEAAYRQMFW